MVLDITVSVRVASPALAAGLRALLEGAGVTVRLTESERQGAPPDVTLLDDDALSDLEHLGLSGGVVALGSPVWASVLSDLAPAGWACLPLDATRLELIAAVLSAAAGLVALTPEQLRYAPQLSPEADGAEESADLHGAAQHTDGGVSLTPREQQVLRLLASGLSNKRAARVLEVSEHTVKFHVQSLYSKLGVSTRAGAVTRGMQLGLLSI